MNRIKATVKNNYSDPAIEQEILNLICYRFSRHNLVALMNKYGPEFLLDFLDAFSGCYFRIPPGGKIFSVLDLYRLYHINKEMKKAYDERREEDCLSLERRFLVQCKAMHIRYNTGRQMIRPIAKEIAEANRWRREMQTLRERQDKREL